MAKIDVKFERLINNSPTMDLNANLHLTLMLEIPNVKVKDKITMDSVYYVVYTCEI